MGAEVDDSWDWQETLATALTEEAAGSDDELAFDAPVEVRLDRDAITLEARLRTDARDLLPDMLASLLHALAAAHDVSLPQPVVDSFLGSAVEEEWITLQRGTPPVPPVDGGLRLAVPAPVARLGACGAVVRAGEVIAHIVQPREGQAGRDVRGHVVEPRRPRNGRPPLGPGVAVGADGATIVATVDGETLYRQARLCVAEGRVVAAADLPDVATLDEDTRPLFVVGGLTPGRVISAAGSITIHGDVIGATVESRAGDVVVAGSVTGTPDFPARLSAGGAAWSGTLCHAEVEAGGDAGLSAGTIRHSTLRAGGVLHLHTRLDECLSDGATVRAGAGLRLAGACGTIDSAGATSARLVTDLPARLWRLTRGATDGEATPCRVVGASVDVLRCHLGARAGHVGVGDDVAIATAFPLDGAGAVPFLARAHVTGMVGETTAVIALTDIGTADAERLSAYCHTLFSRRLIALPVSERPLDAVAAAQWYAALHALLQESP